MLVMEDRITAAAQLITNLFPRLQVSDLTPTSDRVSLNISALTDKQIAKLEEGLNDSGIEYDRSKGDTMGFRAFVITGEENVGKWHALSKEVKQLASGINGELPETDLEKPTSGKWGDPNGGRLWRDTIKNLSDNGHSR